MSNSINLDKKKKKALKMLYLRIQREIRNLIQIATIKSASMPLIDPHQEISNKVMRGLLDEYNSNLKYVGEFIDNNFLIKIDPLNYSEDMFAQLYRIISECEKVISLLEEDKVREVHKYENQLNSLKNEIKKLNLIDLGIKKNIMESINLFERGEIICSTFFASRVISYTISQFNIDEQIIDENEKKKKKESRISIIIKDCISKGLIDKGNKQYINNLFQYITLGRNMLTHDILFFPESAECLGILSNTIELIKLKSKFDEYLQN